MRQTLFCVTLFSMHACMYACMNKHTTYKYAHRLAHNKLLSQATRAVLAGLYTYIQYIHVRIHIPSSSARPHEQFLQAFFSFLGPTSTPQDFCLTGTSPVSSSSSSISTPTAPLCFWDCFHASPQDDVDEVLCVCIYICMYTHTHTQCSLQVFPCGLNCTVHT